MGVEVEADEDDVELTEEDMAELATVKQTRLFTPFPPRWSSVPEYFGDEQTQ